MKLLECNGVTLSYHGKEVVKDLSFSVEKGDYFCIVGENGSGKSTLLKSLLGLKKPEKGTITFADGVTRNRIGYLPQKTAVQRDFPATVEEVVRLGLLGQKKGRIFFSKEEFLRAEKQMEMLEILPLRKQSFRNLSGGQQQRVLLAKALTAAEELLILDEPVNGLDYVVTGELYRHIKEKNKEGMTVIMVSHDMETALHSANKVLHLAEEEYFFGTKSEYIRSSLCRKFLGGVK
jgi:zinc transport system ATP-binding protein